MPEIDALLAGLRGARVYDLEQPRYFGAPIHPSHAPGFVYTLHRRHEPGTGDRRTSAAGAFYASEHAGTHIDALSHQAEDLRLHGGVMVEPEVQGATGFKRHGVEEIAPLVARGVLVDLALQAGVERLARGTRVRLADFKAAVESQGLRIDKGDVVLVRTGNGGLWADPEAYLDGPAMVGEVSAWVASLGPRAVGADNMAWDPIDGRVDAETGTTLPGHVIFLVRNGIYILENLQLEGLAAAGVREFAFVCLPLKMRGATGSPVRPIAIV